MPNKQNESGATAAQSPFEKYPFDASETAWISRGFEVLAERVHKRPSAKHFDVLIVGSGYGGAIAADAFAGCAKKDGRRISVAVLERGSEYLAGAFPAGLRELPRHVRRKSNKEGLFDIRLGAEVTTVVANGLGGGSLINAGVMEVPTPNVFAKGWPRALWSLPDWQRYFDEARELLGARRGRVPNTIREHPDGLPPKFRALEAIAPTPKQFRATEITVAMDDTASSGNVALKKCKRCGDCVTGCNFGAKNSLDVNLLVRAHRKGAEIFSGATVLKIERDEKKGVWVVHCVHTSAKLRSRDETVTQIRATNVVLAAGTLGSTEILLRSRSAALALSPKLGERCSTNGDMLIAQYDTKTDVHTIADEAVQPSKRGIGPTITGAIDLRDANGGVVIEEMSVPASLRRAFTEIFATVNSLHALQSLDWSTHRTDFSDDDLYYAPAGRTERSALYAVMGDDGAAGTIELPKDKALTRHDDGVARLRWRGDDKSHPPKPSLQDVPLFDAQVETLARHAKRLGGRVLPNPVWKLLPKDMEWLLENQRGPLMTVHPLGGCAMADEVADGVVDACGRVFDPNSKDSPVHAGLAVLDGSIIPTALGTNPALTIAAVALRAVPELARDWQYDMPDAAGDQNATAEAPLVRPQCRSTDEAFDPQPTEVEIIERLAGAVTFHTTQRAEPQTRIVEVTLRFAPKPIRDLCAAASQGREAVLRVAADSSGDIRSRIRVYDEVVWREMQKRWSPTEHSERELDAIALFSAPLSGTLRVLERTRSGVIVRIVRAGRAWFQNRGKRDIYQAIKDRNRSKSKSSGLWSRVRGLWSRLTGFFALASRGGEIRALEYELDVGAADPGAVIGLPGTRIRGRKRFTYSHRGNPWRQLMEVELEEFPGMSGADAERVLILDTRHLARLGVPLFRITKQNDGATVLAELASFFGYIVRLLIGIHIWSFRAPDDETPADAKRKDADIDRLPTLELAGLPKGVRHEIEIAKEKPDGANSDQEFSGKVILTNYPQEGKPTKEKPPLLMLHGYSASGTTFAHHSVRHNFAQHFWRSGRDVWIADLRTSAAQKESAERPWSFEQIGKADVPAAVKAILERTGSEQIDVIAHCMGTVVFSMAVLSGTDVAHQVRRAAFTQVGPLVVFSPANIFRGYVMRYLLDFLPEDYSFRPDAPTLADKLLDRLLATLPYPVAEFDVENPPKCSARTPWTRTRHRMDALYGRDFNVANMGQRMLRHIDEHFGPLSLRTVAQTLHFVQYSTITSYQGFNDFVSRNALETLWQFPTFSVHGADNGLAHVSTVDRMRLIFEDAGRTYQRPLVIDGAGHQDALIGSKRRKTQKAIERFLDETIAETEPKPRTELVAYPPWTGPVITEILPTFELDLPPAQKKIPALTMRLDSSPTHRAPQGIAMIRVRVEGDRILRPDDPARAWDDEFVTSHVALLKSSYFTAERHGAYLVPLPERMPSYTEAHRGNALLVLVVYSDSPYLSQSGREYAYFRANVQAQKAEEFLPLQDIAKARLPDEGTLDYEHFVEAARAVTRTLAAYGQPAQKGIPARDLLGHPVLIATKDADRIELPLAEIEHRPKPPSTAQLVFGTSTAAGAAVVGALDYVSNCTDGLITYESPQQIPSHPAAAGTSFALMSCQYPAGFLDEPVAYSSYRRLAERIGSAPGMKPRFLVLTGDQVYVDPTAGLYDPSAKDARYRRPYEAWLRQSEVREVLRRIPSFMLLDDHEIDDNWEPLAPLKNPQQSDPESKANLAANQQARKDGLHAYRRYQRATQIDNKPVDAATGDPSFTFRFDGFPFFMLDTRSSRSPRTVANIADATLFDETRLKAVEKWLDAEPRDIPKFVVTPAMLLPRHRRAVQHPPQNGSINLSALHSDGWDGYPKTLFEILGYIAKNKIPHVVFLSGDEHRGCVASAELRDVADTQSPPTRLHSIHTTAGYAPFPFANSLPCDFVKSETIEFDYDGVRYRCVVEADLPHSRDGAVLLHPFQDERGAWQLDCEFADRVDKRLTI